MNQFKMKAAITSGSGLTHEEICENATILDEGIRLCPLCASEVRLFFINFNEKILMCENTECEYPFGHENVVYVKEDDESKYDEVVSVKSRTARGTQHDTLSMVSTSAWSDIDNINRIYEDEEQLDHRPETREYYSHRKTPRITEDNENKKKMIQNVEDIKKYHRVLNDSKPDAFVKPQLKNEKWIKNLMSIQKLSGKSLLKPNEMKLVDKKEPEIGLGELKIDISMGKDKCDGSSVKIEISSIKQQ